MVEKLAHRVLHVRQLSEGAYVLRFERHGLAFEPGQHLNVGLRGSIAMREYSIYSGSDDAFLEILVREIAGGLVSRALRRCDPGDPLSVEGPYGSFVTLPAERRSARYLFVGSGTGISPFHSLVRSYPDIDYLLLHGVRTSQERFDADAFDPARSVFCVTRTAGGDYRGRVTDYLRGHPVDPGRRCYLCGNSDMIYEAFAVLRDQGVPRDHLHAEIYF
jgi:ferredoxin--NADP+ reductase